MPSGHTHAAISSLAAVSLWMFVHGIDRPEKLALVGGCLAGILITPDLDFDEPVRSHYVVERSFGFLPGLAWRLLWLPYSKVIRHRSPLSHTPLLGTMLRLAYIAVFVLIGLIVTEMAFPSLERAQLPYWYPWAIFGLMISDALHWLADEVVSYAKGRLRTKKHS
jgi:uncharacterized metal-binding protein